MDHIKHLLARNEFLYFFKMRFAAFPLILSTAAAAAALQQQLNAFSGRLSCRRATLMCDMRVVFRI